MSNFLCTAVVFGLLAASLCVWAGVIWRWSRGTPAVDFESADIPLWGLVDVLLAIALLFMFTSMATHVLNEQFDVAPGVSLEKLSLEYHRWYISALALASLATLVTTAGAVMLRCGVSLRGLGFVPQTAWRDVCLGAKAFLALAPPVYVLQYLLVQWVDSKHPMVELLRKHHDPWLMLAGLGSAVVVAPLFEEFLFRGLFQGWLEKLVSRAGHAARVVFAEEEERQDFDVPGHPDHREGAPPRDEPHGELNTDAAPDGGDAEPRESDARDMAAVPSGFAGYLPIVASSALFAALHVSHGPDWVPLFVLALGLGYLYRQTHRLLPCITVHVLLNGCSMGMFLLELQRL